MTSDVVFLFDSRSPAETDRLARHVAAALQPNDVIELHGPLGAGKTRFVQGLAAACGCAEAFVNSPTYVVVQEYDGTPPIYHIDAYRLRDVDEFLELGGAELLESGGVCCIEWAERVADALPREALVVRLEVLGPERRRFEILARGDHWGQRLRSLQQIIASSAQGENGAAQEQ